MKTESMSIHRALAELKLLGSRIQNETDRAVFAGKKKVNGNTIQNMTKEEFKKESRSSLQSVLDLMKRRTAIKSAVVLSNAVTKVSINGEEMTVAEAIDKKNNVENEIFLIEKLKSTARGVHSVVSQENERLTDEALKFFQEITKDKEKLNESSFKSLIETYRSERELEVVEGFDVIKMYKELEDKLEAFLSEVDFVLSSSNTETIIEVSY